MPPWSWDFAWLSSTSIGAITPELVKAGQPLIHLITGDRRWVSLRRLGLGLTQSAT